MLELVFVLLSTAAVTGIGVMSPGPDFLVVSHAAMTVSRKNTYAVVLGVVIGNGLWAAAALFGIGVLFALFPTFYLLFKVLGGLYLIWLGLQMLRGASKPLLAVSSSSTIGFAESLAKGLSTTTANPKPAIYYTSALVAIVPKESSLSMLLATIAIVLTVSAVWFSCVALFLSTPKASSAYGRIKVYLESTFAVLIMLFGAAQMFGR